MTLTEINNYFNSFLHLENFAQDPSKNGIQVQNKSPETQEINKVAFAVDACLETIEKVVESKAQLLVVHHGLFWGHEQAIVGSHYNRLKILIDNDIALYACHLPLDANEEVGNNYGLARKIGLTQLEPFGNWKGMTIGVSGLFESSQNLAFVEEKLEKKFLGVLPFGTNEIKRVAIVSGGAEDMLSEALEKKQDLFITGELSHETYHRAKESRINMISGGHYNTETMGVSLLSEKLQKEKGVETIFIDVPTGL